MDSDICTRMPQWRAHSPVFAFESTFVTFILSSYNTSNQTLGFSEHSNARWSKLHWCHQGIIYNWQELTWYGDGTIIQLISLAFWPNTLVWLKSNKASIQWPRPNLPIGYIGLSFGPQDPRGLPATGTHRVNCRYMTSLTIIRQNFMP